MTDNVKDAEMQQFAESFFANPRVLKLGKELSLYWGKKEQQLP